MNDNVIEQYKHMNSPLNKSSIEVNMTKTGKTFDFQVSQFAVLWGFIFSLKKQCISLSDKAVFEHGTKHQDVDIRVWYRSKSHILVL